MDCRDTRRSFLHPSLSFPLFLKNFAKNFPAFLKKSLGKKL
ncbi:hypothetical protein ANACOL_01313 [Anaerotruncus colihominis DSM 17241]|uniref:Uncharacterized protein n=1 Tax=Anaerotruncus colihominis DSM 17241 TaxID=445972 RepID=B0P968_9FIRM|nr:hypothetical protein ANACOL_01313 [Anaerotruncus colihominis DSM 17241]